MEFDPMMNNQNKVINTNNNAKDGQNKCPCCGSTEIATNIKTGKLKCLYCRHEFEPEKIQGMETDIGKLQGEIMGSGAKDIAEDSKDVITLKCSSCGAQVVIDTSESTQARCHWCRNTLSINQQIPNGAVPDIVLPFGLTKEEAKQEIEKFVGKRKFFAHPNFKKEFSSNNIMGVYFPYVVVDVNSHVVLSGHGESKIRSYTREVGEHKETYYDANLYQVGRSFDLTIEGLTIESNSDKLSRSWHNTNNVINSIMPFDIENAVKYNANYLKGYSSEKRDINIDQLRNLVYEQSKDIARITANDTIKMYDRGVNWSNEELDIKGMQWKTAYLPVWLYSYQSKKGDKNGVLHYVAVNARTKETMGSVPIHMPKLLGISAILELIGFILMKKVDSDISYLFLAIGLVFFFFNYFRYRNSDARHNYETETKRTMFNLGKRDRFVREEIGLTGSKIDGANNTVLRGNKLDKNLMDSLKK